MGIELVVTVIGIVIATWLSIWIYRRTNPKRLLRYRVEVTPLLASAATGGQLSIGFQGRPVVDPQVITISLWSSGRADIGSQAFDAGAPLTFSLTSPIIENVTAGPQESPHLEVDGIDRVVLRPALIHRKFQSTIKLIVDGPPNVTVNRVLPDIDVVLDGATETARAIDSSRKKFRVTALLVATGILILGVMLLIVSLAMSSFDKQAYVAVGGVAILIIIVSLVAIIFIGIYRFIRWIGRNIEARSGLR